MTALRPEAHKIEAVDRAESTHSLWENASSECALWLLEIEGLHVCSDA